MKNQITILVCMFVILLTGCDDGTPVEDIVVTDPKGVIILLISIEDQDGNLISQFTTEPMGIVNGRKRSLGHIFIERNGYTNYPWPWSYFTEPKEFWSQFVEDPRFSYLMSHTGYIEIKPFRKRSSFVHELDLVWLEGKQRFKIRYEYFNITGKCRIFVNGQEMSKRWNDLYTARVVLDLTKVNPDDLP